MSGKKMFLGIALFCGWCTMSFAQQQTGFNLDDHLLIREASRLAGERPNITYEGSPYLHDEFQPGVVYAGPMKFTAVPMRFNISEGVMEYTVKNNMFLLTPDTKITRIDIGDETFTVNSEAGGFCEMVVEGKLTLLAKKVVNYRSKNEITSVPAKYSRQPDQYYVIVAKGPAQKVGNIKSILALLPDKQEELRSFAKAQQLSFKDRADLVKLVTYYNSLASTN